MAALLTILTILSIVLLVMILSALALVLGDCYNFVHRLISKNIWMAKTGRSGENYLAERYDYIIQEWLKGAKYARRFSQEDEVQKCIRTIGEKERYNGSRSFIPWKSNAEAPEDYVRLKEHLKKVLVDEQNAMRDVRQRAQEQERNAQEKAIATAGHELLDRNKDLIDKFIEIAERKVSILDDYGDEKWEVLPDEILGCVKKIAEREGSHLDWREVQKEVRQHGLQFAHWGGPQEYGWLVGELERLFNEHHQKKKLNQTSSTNLDGLLGVEFEVWIAKALKESGFEDVRGTPTCGDQGADLIAKRNGKVIIIQAKRYQGPVGNKAVQEVISAITFYGGDEGWVITNSTFTPSAKALAQKGGIRLIDGETLKDFKSYLGGG